MLLEQEEKKCGRTFVCNNIIIVIVNIGLLFRHSLIGSSVISVLLLMLDERHVRIFHGVFAALDERFSSITA